MSRRAIYSMLLLFFSLISFAQNEVNEPSSNMVTFSVQPESQVQSNIEIKQLHINTEIHGNLAETRMDITFYNPNDRDIAADFSFPVPNQGMISAYALDVNGIMVDGVAVEKQRARVTFEKIVRQGIDPGLVEKLDGNAFKTRIFPLPSKQSRRVQISYVSILPKTKTGYHYQIPLVTKQQVTDFELNIQVMNSADKPLISSAAIDGLSFQSWQNAFISNYKKDQLVLDQSIQVVIPKVKDTDVLIGKNSHQQFHFAINPQIDFKPPYFKNTSLNHIQLVWDASHSRNNSQHLLAFNLLDAFFKQHKDVKVELSWLRNTLTPAETFSIKGGHWSELKKQLQQVNYDGATNLSALNQLPNSKGNEAILLFTDGLHSFDEKNQVITKRKLYVFSPDSTNNHQYNQQMVKQSGGKAYQLTHDTDWQRVVENLHLTKPVLTHIEVVKGQVSDLPSVPLTFESNQTQPITGQLLSKKARLQLHFQHYGTAYKSLIDLKQHKAFDSSIFELVSVQQKLNELQIDSESNKKQIIQLSQQYGLVSDHTSLLVLEELDQYLDHQIAPPKSLPEMRQAYLIEMERLHKDAQGSQDEKINNVLAMWETRKSWWNKTFTPSKPKVDIQGVTANQDETRTAPEPPRMSVNTTEDDQDELEEQGRVTVTGSRIDSSDFADNDTESSGPKVQISAWNPSTPYLTKLKSVDKNLQIPTYYQLKEDHVSSPAFYFDCANFFFEQQQPAFGLQVLSNIAELKTRDARLLRIMAMKLLQHRYLDLSTEVYRQVLSLRPEEPQSYRDLGLALMRRGDQQEKNKAREDYQQALKYLYKVITEPWDRFAGIEVTALMELNRLLPKLKALKIDASFIDPRLMALLDVDLRITLSWDTDMTDIDLWVIEPSKEKVSYDNTLSQAGGKFHEDFTEGYGPEEYLIKKAPRGEYTIKVHFYGNNSPELSGPTTLYVDIFTHYGRSNESKQTLSVRLEKAEDDYLVGKITF